MVSATRLERSARSKPGWATMSWAMAGTTKAATGRCPSTNESHSPGSNRGWYQPLSPPRIGPWTSRAPLVVENGEEVRKPRPFQSAGRSPGSGSGCRTTTALGTPVVPEVYMMSIDPAPSGVRDSVEESASNSANQS